MPLFRPFEKKRNWFGTKLSQRVGCEALQETLTKDDGQITLAKKDKMGFVIVDYGFVIHM